MPDTPTANQGGRSVGYQPALDGLRAVCLVGVLLFHAPYPWMSGGFLGVSTFFTLSGFLITSLLLSERERSGGIDFARFWERRLRRLGPALWLGIAAIVASSPLWIAEAPRLQLPWDAASAALFFSNWRFATPEYAYANLFDAPSALQHTWSLSIEAQFYLVFPALLPLALRWRAAPLVAILAAASVAACWHYTVTTEATYRSYYGTDARAAEILAGVLLALVWNRESTRRFAARPALAAGAGSAALAAIIVIWVVTEVESAWLYRGGFGAYAVLSAVVVAAAVATANPFGRLLSLGPLVWLGRISYGAYVYHWPIFLWLSPERTGLELTPLFGLRVAVTLLVSDLSYRWLEEPVRYARWSVGRPRVLGLALAAPAAAFLAATVLRPGGWASDDSAFAEPDPTRVAALVSRSVDLKFAMFGDSAAITLLPGIGEWLQENGIETVKGNMQIGCSMLEDGFRLGMAGWAGSIPKCRGWLRNWQDAMRADRADIGIVLTGVWDVLDRKLPGENQVRSLGDPVLDAKFQQRVAETIEGMADFGVQLVWLTCPELSFEPGRYPFVTADASDPARVRRHNQLLREVAARYPAHVRVVDLAAWVAENPWGLADEVMRPDGIHFSIKAQRAIGPSIGPEILAAALDLPAAPRP